MHRHQPVQRVVDLTDPTSNCIFNMTADEALQCVASGDPQRVRAIDGAFALVHWEGQTVRLAHTIARPLRYFIAKRSDGPCLVVAERIDAIRDFLNAEGLGNQFHPSYTRMVPAHHLVEIALIGCPDPNPTYHRFFEPQHDQLPADLDEIGRRYMSALAAECERWLDRIDERAPIGVLFSGGIDSGSVLLVLNHLLLSRGQSPARLKAFTLSIDEQGADARQAVEFLKPLGLDFLLEVIEVNSDALSRADAIRAIEDYKPLDVQSAAMALALCRGIRQRYPDWQYLVDGDGGDENLKDYPIEENPELTIRSVLNNRLLYQEGWGVNAMKHSLTYSGGQSRGHVRSYAPAKLCGFSGFSPYALPAVIEVAEGIPFIELTDWSHDRLYALKGQVVQRGIQLLTGITMPVFEKRRFNMEQLSVECLTTSFRTIKPFIAASSLRFMVDISERAIVAARPPKNRVHPRRPYLFFAEPERTAAGTIEDVATIFLTNHECPWRCLMCDLWKNTLDARTERGAIPEQIDFALAQLPATSQVKLYNSGNFFDAQAIPAQDHDAIIARVRHFQNVIVENHPRLCGDACVQFRDRLGTNLEIAMGLETVHPEVLAKLNKGMTLDHFDQAASFLHRHDIEARAFVLLRPPFLTEHEGIEWAIRSVRHAFQVGVRCCCVIPVRGGNGILEQLRASGDYDPPRLRSLEYVLEACLASLPKGYRVFADLWDVEQLEACESCQTQRIARLREMNFLQLVLPTLDCECCA